MRGVHIRICRKGFGIAAQKLNDDDEIIKR